MLSQVYKCEYNPAPPHFPKTYFARGCFEDFDALEAVVAATRLKRKAAHQLPASSASRTHYFTTTLVLKAEARPRTAFCGFIDENGGEPGARLEGGGNRRNNNRGVAQGEAAPTGPVSPRPGAEQRPADDLRRSGYYLSAAAHGRRPAGSLPPNNAVNLPMSSCSSSSRNLVTIGWIH